jgi:SAM-dependent methyltransferase
VSESATSEPVVDVAPSQLGDFAEYEDPTVIDRYRWGTSGEGINHLLPNVYGPLFLDGARAAQKDTGAAQLRVLEFGCGAGMALQLVAERLDAEGMFASGIGTDFAPSMVEAARREAASRKSPAVKERLQFAVATNEDLAGGISRELGVTPESLAGTFHLIIGVNTFRYAIRHGMSREVIEQLHTLLAPGGRVVNIDMNDRFPYGLKPKRRTSSAKKSSLPIEFGTAELPSLEQYATPFREGGFEVLRAGNFCWIPHSARGVRFRALKAAEPLLDKLVPDRAMRSLIVARRV